MALRGDGGIAIDLVGRVDSVHGGMRASFEVLPDAPASRFELTLFGGKRGLLENSTNLCAAPLAAQARFAAHNNLARAFKVPLGNQCKKKHKRNTRHHKRGRG